MKKTGLLIFILNMFAFIAHAEVHTYPSDYSNDKVPKSDIYEVTVIQNGTAHNTMVYKSVSNGSVDGGRNKEVYNNSISWTNFSFSGEITLRVKLKARQTAVSYGTAKIFPARRKITPKKIDNQTLEFTISEPGQFSVEFSNTAYKHGLMVFADPLETRTKPSGSNTKICTSCTASDLANLSGKTAVFFKDGHHDIGIWKVPTTIKEIYIEGGALVEGAIHLMNSNNDNTLIHGRGILDGRRYYDKDPSNKKHAIESTNSVSGTTVDGVVVSQAGAFFVRLLGTENEILWTKTIGGWIFNNDGLVGYENTTIKNCFVWANDDGIKLYRNNTTVENITAWHLTNGGVFQWCWNTISAKNIRVKNVDIIRGQWPGDGQNQGVFNIRGSSTNQGIQTQEDWVFENIYIDNPVKVLFNMAPQVAHNVNNVTFRNIQAKTTSDVINRIEGYNASHKISNVTIENLTMNGTCIDDNNKGTVGKFQIKNTNNLSFKCSTVTEPEPDPVDPVISFADPAKDQTISSTYTVKVNAYDADYGTNNGDGITSVYFQLFDANDATSALFAENINTAPFEWTLNTKNFHNGDYELRAGVQSEDFTTGRKWTVLKPITIQNTTVTPPAGNGKPSVWIQTDGTAILGFDGEEAITDQNSDPDDQVALANYLMLANQFNTVGIVMGVTNRNTTENSLESFNNYFRVAYAKDYTCLSKNFEGYPAPEDIPVYESSCTEGNNVIQFDGSNTTKYDEYNNLLKTVQLLVDELKSDTYSEENPLYVCVWGGMTETAMALKHLIRNNETEALKRMHIVSHWHTSYSNTQSANGCYTGTDAEKYGCANCNVDCDACKYVRDEAKKADALICWTDVGAIGQTGIVSGSNGYFDGGISGTTYKQFQKSALGDLFVKSKFAYGKPDGSDMGAMYVILGNYGVTLNDINDNGQLTEAQEIFGKETFKANAHDLLDELLAISDIAAGTCETVPSDITDLKATADDCNTVSLMWTDASGEDGYRIRRKVAGGVFEVLEDITANTTLYTDNTALENTTYMYQVRPMQGGAAAANSNQPEVSTHECVIIQEPQDLTDLKLATENCSTVVLTWTDTQGEEAYRVRRKVAGEATFINLTDVSANSETYTDETSETGVTYVYMVRPVVDGKAVNVSNQPEITLPECTPSELTQTIELKQGWNLISLYVEPENRQTGTVFPNAEIVKTFDAFYKSDQEPFLNSLQTLEAGTGYLVYNSIDETIILTGVETHGRASLLTDGWNLIGITNNTEITDLPADIIIIKDFSLFYEKGSDLNSLTTLEKGEAYFIFK